VRATAIAGDPKTGLSAPNCYIPSVNQGSGFRDAIIERYTWVEIPRATSDDLTQGTGRRFAVLDVGIDRRIRVLTDTLGLFQAFLEE
jgi:hypothetical protein